MIIEEFALKADNTFYPGETSERLEYCSWNEVPGLIPGFNQRLNRNYYSYTGKWRDLTQNPVGEFHQVQEYPVVAVVIHV